MDMGAGRENTHSGVQLEEARCRGWNNAEGKNILQGTLNHQAGAGNGLPCAAVKTHKKSAHCPPVRYNSQGEGGPRIPGEEKRKDNRVQAAPILPEVQPC